MLRAYKNTLLAFRFALREMRGGLKGFYIFIICIALGVAAMGGINSISAYISGALSEQGRNILGADMRFSLTQRAATAAERDFLAQYGTVSENITMRSMASTDTDQTALVELKAVDDLYPLAGKFLTNPENYQQLLAFRGGQYGALVSPLLLSQLQLKVGDDLQIGQLNLQIRGTIVEEPDLLSAGFLLAPRVIIANKAMIHTQLIQDGSLLSFHYLLSVANTATADFNEINHQFKETFPNAAYRFKESSNASPALMKNLARFQQFLSLLSLMVLVIGGLGIANAMRAYLDKKKIIIATLKSLGASGNFAILVYLFQMIMIAGIGILIGLIFAILMPFLARFALQAFLPNIGMPSIYIFPLLLAITFSVLTLLSFCIPILGRIKMIPVTQIFRGLSSGSAVKAPLSAWLLAGFFLMLLIMTAIYSAYEKGIALVFIIVIALMLLILKFIANIVQYIAKYFAHSKSTTLRLAIGNIYRPNALTPAIMVALGMGLTLLVALNTVDGSLRQQLSQGSGENSPDLFFIDIPNQAENNFTTLIESKVAAASFKIMPMLRARVTAFNDKPIKLENIADDSRWAVRGDRNVTFAADIPKNTQLSAGSWWPENYQGEPLVSISEKEAKAFHLKIGDHVQFNVLGRNINAKIANYRAVEWDSLKMNFVFIFSPNTFAGAPHTWLAALTLPEDKNDAAAEGAIVRTVNQHFPTVTSISIHNVLSIAQKYIDQIAMGIRGAAIIAILSAIFVLSGALSASNAARSYDVVILKTLGARRKTLMKAFVIEYTILGLISGTLAYFAGTAIGYSVIKWQMHLQPYIPWEMGLIIIATALFLSISIGLIGTWRVLGQKPSDWLKEA